MMSRTLQSRWQKPDLSAFEDEINSYLNAPTQVWRPKMRNEEEVPQPKSSEELRKLSAPGPNGGSPLAPTSSARPGRPPASLDDMDVREVLARTVAGEAGGEIPKGKQGVLNVIMNRAKHGGYGGTNLRDVSLAPGQFSMWNGLTGYAKGEGGLDPFKVKVTDDIYGLVDQALAGNLEDVTGGALNYYNDAVADPKWGANYNGNFPLRIGNHIYGWAG